MFHHNKFLMRMHRYTSRRSSRSSKVANVMRYGFPRNLEEKSHFIWIYSNYFSEENDSPSQILGIGTRHTCDSQQALTNAHINLVFTSNICINKITKDKFSSGVYKDKADRILLRIYKDKADTAYTRNLACRMSHASVDFFVLSFVLPCAYAYVASEDQA